ncbi:MAG: ribbon-helix-helix domain-containing protein [Candidatus Methanofastidiosia archaeon]|jgi:Arc/MetJ-type ribon-helix-helix transcriptional regulator
MTDSQLNVTTSDTLIKALDQLIDSGIFKNRTEAVNEAIRLLIRRYKKMKITDNINKIAKENYGEGHITATLFGLREEEDL